MANSPDNPETEPTVESPPVAEERIRPWASLTFRNYRLLWGGWVCGAVGQQMRELTNLYLVFQISESTVQLGLLGLTRAVPLFVLGLFGGALADHMDRKRLIILTQAANLAVAAIIAVLAVTELIAVWHLYATTIATSSLMILEMPARTALVPSTVPRSHLLNAFTLNSFVRQGAMLVGPALGGFMIDLGGGGASGAAVAYVAALAVYIPVFATLVLLRLPAQGGLVQGETRRFRASQIADGLKYIWATSILLAIISLDAGVALLTGYRALLPVFAETILFVSGTGLGLLLAAPAVGFIIGSFALLIIGRMSRTGLVVLLSVAGYAVALALFALSSSFWLSFVFLTFVGGLDGISSIVRQTTLQLIVPDAVRGRASSVQQVLAVGSPSIGQFLAGVVAAPIGSPNAVLVGSALSLVFVGMVALRWREVAAFRA